VNTVWVLTNEYAVTDESDDIPGGGLSLMRVFANREDALSDALAEVANASDFGYDEDEDEPEDEPTKRVEYEETQSGNTWVINHPYNITTIKVQIEKVR
jgi:hypothetical protein